MGCTASALPVASPTSRAQAQKYVKTIDAEAPTPEQPQDETALAIAALLRHFREAGSITADLLRVLSSMCKSQLPSTLSLNAPPAAPLSAAQFDEWWQSADAYLYRECSQLRALLSSRRPKSPEEMAALVRQINALPPAVHERLSTELLALLRNEQARTNDEAAAEAAAKTSQSSRATDWHSRFNTQLRLKDSADKFRALTQTATGVCLKMRSVRPRLHWSALQTLCAWWKVMDASSFLR